jgi:hypothetical protein
MPVQDSVQGAQRRLAVVVIVDICTVVEDETTAAERERVQ